MTMRKKDYEAIARIILARGRFMPHTEHITGTGVQVTTPEWMAILCLSRDIADYCATQDPTFKRDRFLADCGVSQS